MSQISGFYAPPPPKGIYEHLLFGLSDSDSLTPFVAKRTPLNLTLNFWTWEKETSYLATLLKPFQNTKMMTFDLDHDL